MNDKDFETKVNGFKFKIALVYEGCYRVSQIGGFGDWFLVKTEAKNVVKIARKTLKEIYKNGSPNFNPREGDKYELLKDVEALVCNGHANWTPSKTTDGFGKEFKKVVLLAGTKLTFYDKSSWNQEQTGYGYCDFKFNGVVYHIRKQFGFMIMDLKIRGIKE